MNPPSKDKDAPFAFGAASSAPAFSFAAPAASSSAAPAFNFGDAAPAAGTATFSLGGATAAPASSAAAPAFSLAGLTAAASSSAAAAAPAFSLGATTSASSGAAPAFSLGGASSSAAAPAFSLASTASASSAAAPAFSLAGSAPAPAASSSAAAPAFSLGATTSALPAAGTGPLFAPAAADTGASLLGGLAPASGSGFQLGGSPAFGAAPLPAASAGVPSLMREPSEVAMPPPTTTLPATRTFSPPAGSGDEVALEYSACGGDTPRGGAADGDSKYATDDDEDGGGYNDVYGDDDDDEYEYEYGDDDGYSLGEEVAPASGGDTLAYFARNLARHPVLRTPRPARVDPAGRPQLAAVNTAYSQLFVLKHQQTGGRRAVRLCVTDLERVKNHGTAPVQEIECDPPLPEDADRLVFNETGDFLAVLSPGGCTLVQLPKPGLESLVAQRATKVRCRTYVVGAYLHGTVPGLRVLQAEFHPLSSRHLVLLTSDAHLRVFHVTSSVSRPEQEFPLRHRDIVRFAFGGGRAGVMQRRAVSLLHRVSGAVPDGGAGAAGAEPAPPGAWWAALTVLLLRGGGRGAGDGAVYALCPVVPSGCRATEACVARLGASLGFASYADRADPSSARDQAGMASDWLRETWCDPVAAGEQEELGAALARSGGADGADGAGEDHGRVLVATPPAVALALQGPFRAVGAPVEGAPPAAGDGAGGGDLAVVDADAPFGAVCVAGSPGAPLEVLLALEGVVPRFGVSEHPPVAPSLLRLDAVPADELVHSAEAERHAAGGAPPAGAARGEPARLLAGRAAGAARLFWHCPGAGMAEVGLPWLDGLVEAFESGEARGALARVARGARCDPRLVALAPPGPAAAAFVLSLPTTGRYAVSADAELRCVVAEVGGGLDDFDSVLPDLRGCAEDAPPGADEAGGAPHEVDDEGLAAHGLPPFADVAAPFLEHFREAMPSERIAPLRMPGRLEDPQSLAEVFDSVRDPMNDVMLRVEVVRQQVEARVASLNEVVQSQAEQFGALDRDVRVLMLENERLQERLHAAFEVQPHLLEYVQLALRTHAERNANELSAAERRFQADVRRKQAEARSFGLRVRGLRRKAEALQKQRRRRARMPGGAAAGGGLSSRQLSRLGPVLEEHTAALKGLHERIGELAARLGEARATGGLYAPSAALE